MNNCAFCEVAAGKADAVVLCEDAELMAFLDITPIRTGHTQIIPKRHYETFEVIPSDLAGRILVLGQEIAKRIKATYGVGHVAFLFTGGDVAHAHAHIVPMHAKTDITSARYMLAAQDVRWGSEHLRADRATLLAVKAELGFMT